MHHTIQGFMVRGIGAAAVLALASCTGGQIIDSKPGKGREAIGQYAIPKAVIEVLLELKYPESALTQGRLAASSSRSLVIKEFKVHLVPAAYVPVYYDPSAFSDDKVTLELTAHSFLKQVSVDVEDKSGEFITKLADLGIGAAKLATQYPASVLTIDKTKKEVTQEIRALLDPYQKTIVLDPIPEVQADNITIQITTLGASVETVGPVDDSPSAKAASLNAAIAAKCGVHLCYPALVSKKVTFSGPIGTAEDRLIVVPDPMHIVTIDLRRASLVQKTLVADFDEGMLKKVVLSKPSEALGVIQVPLDIVEKLISLPTELIQLKIDTTEKQTKLLDAQQKLIDAQIKLIEAVEKAKEEAAKREQDSDTGPFGGSN